MILPRSLRVDAEVNCQRGAEVSESTDHFVKEVLPTARPQTTPARASRTLRCTAMGIIWPRSQRIVHRIYSNGVAVRSISLSFDVESIEQIALSSIFVTVDFRAAREFINSIRFVCTLLSCTDWRRRNSSRFRIRSRNFDQKFSDC